MKRHQGMIAGTALALLMGASQLGAAPLGTAVNGSMAGLIKSTHQGAGRDATFPLILAQAQDEELEEEDGQPETDNGDVEEAEPETDESEPEPEPEIEEGPEPEAEPEPEPEVEEPEVLEEPEPEPEPEVEEEPEAEPVEEPADEPAEELEEPADEPELPAEELEEPADEPAEEPAEELLDEPVDESEQPVEDLDEPVEELDEPVEEPLDEPVTDEAEPVDDLEEPVDEPGQPIEGTEESPDELLEEAEPADEGEAIDEDADAAPLLDSEKEEETAVEPEIEEDGEPETVFEPLEDDTPPASDAESQRFEEPVEIQSLRAEEGQRIDTQAYETRRERREGANVLEQIQNRFVIQFNNQTIVESDDRERLGRDATEVYYDELPRGHTRETIVRPNGVQVVTIRDAYGDIVRRSRIMPDGEEYVLIYADERGRDRPGRRGWRDPARELPPMRLTIPREEYILEAAQVRDYDRYYDFLHQPPVEPVRRLYSVDEVKYSARVRDISRRIDIDTVTFEFGSASISESEIPMLEGIASAMERMLDENPAETFLIEGHTDAVGSEQANLVLSDRRAESVAMALTNVFGIPAENLVTQGYGKRYLKVDTQEPERRNRRVAIRRITPLVAPVAELR